MKRILAVVLLVFTLLSVTACGSKEPANPSTCNHNYQDACISYTYMGECPSCYCVVQGTDKEVLLSVTCKKCGQAKPDWEKDADYAGLAKFKCKECGGVFVVDVSTEEVWADDTIKTDNIAKEVAE